MRMVFIYIPSTAAIACATDRNMLQSIHVGSVAIFSSGRLTNPATDCAVMCSWAISM